MIRKLNQRNVSTAIVLDEKNFFVSHLEIKCFEPFKENNLCHPNLRIIAVDTTQVVEIDVLKATWTLEFSNDPQRKFVRTIAVAPNNKRKLPVFQLLGHKRVIGLITEALVIL